MNDRIQCRYAERRRHLPDLLLFYKNRIISYLFNYSIQIKAGISNR